MPWYKSWLDTRSRFLIGLALILGIDRFMSEARAITNLIGNAVAIRIQGPDDFEAAAETTRHGGGSAMVVEPR